MKSTMAIDNPIRWKLLMLNKNNQRADDDIHYCPCGTKGSCEVCACASEYLYGRWLAVLHPFKWLWCKVTRRTFY